LTLRTADGPGLVVSRAVRRLGFTFPSAQV
jgi:hypothetical protein